MFDLLSLMLCFAFYFLRHAPPLFSPFLCRYADVTRLPDAASPPFIFTTLPTPLPLMMLRHAAICDARRFRRCRFLSMSRHFRCH